MSYLRDDSPVPIEKSLCVLDARFFGTVESLVRQFSGHDQHHSLKLCSRLYADLISI